MVIASTHVKHKIRRDQMSTVDSFPYIKHPHPHHIVRKNYTGSEVDCSSYMDIFSDDEDTITKVGCILKELTRIRDKLLNG